MVTHKQMLARDAKKFKALVQDTSQHVPSTGSRPGITSDTGGGG
jgi:hypothetical protein